MFFVKIIINNEKPYMKRNLVKREENIRGKHHKRSGHWRVR